MTAFSENLDEWVMMSAHLETRRNTRKKTSDVSDGNCHFIINIKLHILKVMLFSVKDYNLKTDAIIKLCKLEFTAQSKQIMVLVSYKGRANI